MNYYVSVWQWYDIFLFAIRKDVSIYYMYMKVFLKLYHRRVTCFQKLFWKQSLYQNAMKLFYTHPWIDICMKRKKITIISISFSNVQNCLFSLQIDLESFVLGLSVRSRWPCYYFYIKISWIFFLSKSISAYNFVPVYIFKKTITFCTHKKRNSYPSLKEKPLKTTGMCRMDTYSFYM